MYADTYALEDHFWWFVGMRAIGHAFLAPLYPRGGTLDILDVGCGTGANLQLLLAEYGAPVGVDFAHDAVVRARRRWPGELVQASADALPFADATFDLVTALGVICQWGVRSDLAVLEECYRVLRPGGRVLLHVPAYPFLYAQHDRVGETRERYYRGQLLARVERAGFVVEKCTHANMWLFPLAAAKRLAERIHPPSNPTASDLLPLPGPINTVFRWVLCSEAALIRRWELPFGLSLLALARKPEVAVRPAAPRAQPGIAAFPEPRAPAAPSVGAGQR
jgi:SAM-dependent methyltransferase